MTSRQGVKEWSADQAYRQDVLEADEQGNVVTASLVELIDSKNNIIVSEGDHLFGLIGVKDLVVVHSPQATLVCHKSQAQRVKELVARLEEQGRLASDPEA